MNGQSVMPDAAMWRLRAEEYRTMAATMDGRGVREAFAGMAASCERLAENATFVQEPLTRASCLARAEACSAFAEALQTKAARAAVLKLVGRWRSLADQVSQPQAGD